MANRHVGLLALGLLPALGQAQSAQRTLTASSFCLLNGEAYENRAYVLEELAKCPAGTDLAVLPHMPFLSFATAQAATDLGDFAQFARQRSCYLALAMTERDGERTYFSAMLFGRDGAIVGKYRKAHALPDDTIALGDDLPVFQTDFGLLGLTIGTDFYLPEVYQVMSLKGADLLTWHHYPERLRDHGPWEPMLMARCLDAHAHLVTAMYADPRTYITNAYDLGMPGAAWGRSMVLNRVGTPVADTGYEDGIASARINLDKRKLDVYLPEVTEAENIFYVNNFGDRTAFNPIAQPWQPPVLPAYTKRTCRLVVGTFSRGQSWVRGRVPDLMLGLLERAAELKPDLILLSEQSTNAEDETTRQVMQTVAAKAAAMQCYIAIGGIGDAEQLSILRVWDRTGKEIYGQALYWPKGYPEIRVFDTDFGRVASHECGDLYIMEFDRVLALLGAEIILDGSQMWGASGRTNETLLRARAADNGVWLACAHWPTSDTSLRSLIIDPYGQIMASSEFGKDTVIHLDIDLSTPKVYYAGRKAEQAKRGEHGIPSYFSEDLPEQRWGWREMIFRARRPDLYGILPTTNEVTRRYRSEKSPVP
jgi:predicted amidohydrolase